MIDWRTAVVENTATAREQYVAVADPYKHISVHPFAIESYCRMHGETKRRLGSKLFDMGTIKDGEWDHSFERKQNPSIGSLKIIRAVESHFREGVNWEDTGIIEHKLIQIKHHPRGVVDGCRNRDDLLARYDRLDQTARDIMENGYRLYLDDENPSRFNYYNSISVSIGRDGALLLGMGGLHRLGILRAIGYGNFPVFVLTRHIEWQKKRENFRSLSEKELSHPDLDDLRSDLSKT